MNSFSFLNIDSSSHDGIEKSFERISKELLNNYSIRINDFIFHFTEIEFYYYYKGIHEDENTHEHNLPSGKWRCHNQGLDITFESTNISDGGILIRGIKQINPFLEEQYVNGSRRVLFKLFECMNDVLTTNSGLVIEKLTNPHNHEIYRTSRQGIKQDTYINNKYRYFTEQKNWKKKHILTSDKVLDESKWEEIF